MKKIFLLISMFVFLDASQLVIKASKNIEYKSKIKKSDLFLDYADNIKKFCQPITKEDILNNKYRAKIHIRKGHIICKKDLLKLNAKSANRILFNFGSIEIERDGKIIRETKDYIRIKNENGKIEKIYKDGRTR